MRSWLAVVLFVVPLITMLTCAMSPLASASGPCTLQADTGAPSAPQAPPSGSREGSAQDEADAEDPGDGADRATMLDLDLLGPRSVSRCFPARHDRARDGISRESDDPPRS